jgi:uncharacterized protein YceK
MRRIILLLALLALLSACSSAPNLNSGSNQNANAVWDQSNFETTNWN